MRAEEGTAGEPAAEDAILKAEPRKGAAPAEVVSGSLPAPERAPTARDGTVWGRRNGEDLETRYRGWLPSGRLLTPGELLSGIFVAALLPLAEAYAQVPGQLVGDETLVARLCGLAGGLCVVLCRRSSRLARRAHLRGER